VSGPGVTFNLEQPSPDSVKGIVGRQPDDVLGIVGSAQGSIEGQAAGRSSTARSRQDSVWREPPP
jgi:hypothetical protein